MTVALLQFLVSAAAIIVLGTILARCADAIAELTGLGRLLVGSVLLAGATSLPEMSVVVNAARMDKPNLGLGNLAGSCLMNLIILAIADLMQKQRGALLSNLAAAHALSGVQSIALIAIAGLFISFETLVQSAGLFGMSWGSLLIAAAYLLGIRLIYHDQQVSARQAKLMQPHAPDARPRFSLTKTAIGFLFAAGGIVAVAPFLARSADSIADLTGLGGTFVGTTLLAVSTVLPELVSTLAAVRLGSIDLAIGNVFGSNSFNMLLIVGMDLAFQGPILASANPAHAITCFGTIVISSVVILGQLYRVEKRVFLVEPDAFLICLLSAGTLLLVFLAR